MLQWVALIAVAIAAGKALSYSGTLKELRATMAGTHEPGVQPIQCQNILTPPWLTNLMIISWVDLIIISAWIWHLNGWQQGLCAALAGLLLPAIFQAALPPRRGSGLFLRHAFHSMINRQADYEREGDNARARAIAATIELMLKTYPEPLDTFDRKTRNS